MAILHPHGGMGDLLLSYPVIQAFSGAFPSAEIFYVAPPGLLDVVRAHPDVHDVLELMDGLKPALELAGYLREKKVELACALWSTSRIAWILRLSRIPIRIGQGGRLLSSFLFTHRVPVRSVYGDAESHWVECLLDYPKSVGISASNTSIKVEPSHADQERAVFLLKEAEINLSNPIIVIHAGKGEDLIKRNWPVALFGRVGDSLIQEGFQVVFTGSSREIGLVENIRKGMKFRASSMAGKTDFLTLAALLKHAQCTICPDSGPMHLSAAVGTPVVALFAMKKDEPGRWRPWGIPHTVIRPESFPCRSWCAKETCPDFQCYHRLNPEEIVKAALLLASGAEVKR